MYQGREVHGVLATASAHHLIWGATARMLKQFLDLVA